MVEDNSGPWKREYTGDHEDSRYTLGYIMEVKYGIFFFQCHRCYYDNLWVESPFGPLLGGWTKTEYL